VATLVAMGSFQKLKRDRPVAVATPLAQQQKGREGMTFAAEI
jgi:hypothetical protein